MNSEQEKELLDHLKSLGFESEQLKTEVQAGAEKDTPSFRVNHTIFFGEERMQFDLDFRKDTQFDTYRLEKYNATLRAAVPIEHHLINGIDTSELDKKMQTVDWNKYFEPGSQYTASEFREIKGMLSDLWELTAELSEAGAEIQDKLQFKHFPENKMDDPAKDLKRIYEKSRSFSESGFGLCPAGLAYNMLSGRLGDLHEKLIYLQLDWFTNEDIYSKLEKALSKNPDSFTLDFQWNTPEGYSELSIPVPRIDGWYHIDTYKLTLTPYPPIGHGIYNGVDTGQLERQMQQVDWHNDNELFIFHEDSEPEFLPKIGDIQEQMYRLSQDMAGTEIADRLHLKYWVGVTFFDDMIQQSGWDLLDELPKRTHNFPVETESKTAYNLLCGRAVCSDTNNIVTPGINHWKKMDFSHFPGDHYPISTIPGFSENAFWDTLNMLPLTGPEFNRSPYLIRDLLKGSLVPANLKNGETILLHANPERQSIDIYSKDMRPIYTNIQMDPDWKPPLSETTNPKQHIHKIRPAPQSKKGKGKGLK